MMMARIHAIVAALPQSGKSFFDRLASAALEYILCVRSAMARKRRFRVWALVAAAAVVLLVVAVRQRLRDDIPLETLTLRYAGPPSKFVAAGGLRVHYRDEGRGSAIVLLHGTSSSLHTWDGWAAVLARKHRVVRFDLPAFGLTGPNRAHDYRVEAYVRFVEQVTAALGVPRFVLAGNSLGGNVAWHFALQYPERVRALVLVDASGYPSSARALPWAFRIAHWPLVPQLLVDFDPRPLVEDGLRKSYGDAARIRAGVVDRYVELSLRPGNREAFIQRMRTRSPDDSATIKALRVPTLILWGARDRLIDVENARRFAADIEGARLVVYPELGHVPMEEDPSRTVRDLETFMARVP
jgi:pimeloyl-ACP methyl ester carboxylesterase